MHNCGDKVRQRPWEGPGKLQPQYLPRSLLCLLALLWTLSEGLGDVCLGKLTIRRVKTKAKNMALEYYSEAKK